MRLALAAASFAILCAPVPASAAQEDPGQALAAAVDLRDAKARRAAARELAKRDDVDLERWLELMRTFPCRGEVTPGRRTEVVELWVDGKTEKTELVIFVPIAYDPERPSPLMVTFHGTGGNGGHVVRTWQGTADDLGMLVLAPSEAGPNAGFAATQRERDAALSALRWMRREFNVDENRIYASGFSRGGHITWDLALRYPDHFAAIVPMVGGPRWEPARGAANLRYLENVKHLSIRDLQGAHDQEGLVWNVRLAFERLAKLDARDAVLHEFPDLGHDVDMNAVRWHQFLGAAVRDPMREEVVRAYAREGEGRAAWAEVLESKKPVKEVFQPRVNASKYNAMSLEEKRMVVIEAGDEHTGRLAVRRTGPGAFEVKTRGIARFRLLLTAEMIDPKGAVSVKTGGRAKKKRPKPSKRVLLEEFVERFDRTFLPIAELVLRG
ncbi:MAG: hypothetical protein GY711_08715 [bacterium]|nr:hypothetical protein [bacterium]